MDMEAERSTGGPAKAGIAGWLLLPALGLLVQVYAVVEKLVLDPQKWRGRGYSVIYRTAPLVADLILLAIVLVAAWLFFRRRRLAPPVYVLTVMAAFLAWVVVVGLSPTFRDEPIIGIFFNMLVFPAYFVSSRRVQATFTRELDHGLLPDRLLTPVESVLISCFEWLLRRRRWLVLYVVLVLVVGVVLQTLMRAVFVLGDVRVFKQLLLG
jgi:hypothetical protein